MWVTIRPLNLILDTSANSSNPSCPVTKLYDLDEDCNIDDDDLQALIDFARGLPSAQFPFINRERGSWKLGNAPNAIQLWCRAMPICIRLIRLTGSF